MKLYMFRTVPLVHQQEFIHCTLNNVICHTGLWTAFEQEHMLQNKFVKLVHLVCFITKKKVPYMFSI